MAESARPGTTAPPTRSGGTWSVDSAHDAWSMPRRTIRFPSIGGYGRLCRPDLTDPAVRDISADIAAATCSGAVDSGMRAFSRPRLLLHVGSHSNKVLSGPMLFSANGINTG